MPMMRQYLEMKRQFVDCLLFFRLGGFYQKYLPVERYSVLNISCWTVDSCLHYNIVHMEEPLPTKQFQRRIENFSCDHCGYFVRGTGYTNHCPKCLWSRHVDKNPGDRAGECGGMMEPIGVEIREGGYVIIHRCLICKHERKNSLGQDDDLNALIEISAKAGSF